jgi:hypothetical protein
MKPQMTIEHQQEDLNALLAANIPSLDSRAVADRFWRIEKKAPQELLDRLSGLGDILQQTAWEIGWQTNELYNTLKANGLDENYLLVCYYVSIRSLRGFRRMNTVRAYAYTARFFPRPVAKKYHNDELHFSHFVYAKGFGDQPSEYGTGGYKWQDVLNYSYARFMDMGRPASVAELREVFEGKTPPAKRGLPDVTDKPQPSVQMASEMAYLQDIEKLDLDPRREAGNENVGLVIRNMLNLLTELSNYIPAIARIPGIPDPVRFAMNNYSGSIARMCADMVGILGQVERADLAKLAEKEKEQSVVVDQNRKQFRAAREASQMDQPV